MFHPPLEINFPHSPFSSKILESQVQSSIVFRFSLPTLNYQSIQLENQFLYIVNKGISIVRLTPNLKALENVGAEVCPPSDTSIFLISGPC